MTPAEWIERIKEEGYQEGYRQGWLDGETEAQNSLESEATPPPPNLDDLKHELKYLELRYHGDTAPHIIGLIQGYREAVKILEGE